MKNYNILQKLCKRIFYVGFGNLWFENGVLGDENSIPYRIYFYISFSLYGFLTLLEVMAALFADFPEDEKRDSVTFSVAHTIVMIKMFSIIVNKKNIKKLISDIIAVCESHEEESLMNEKYKVMKINVIAYFFTCYSSAACFVFEGLRKMYEGKTNNNLVVKIKRRVFYDRFHS